VKKKNSVPSSSQTQRENVWSMNGWSRNMAEKDHGVNLGKYINDKKLNSWIDFELPQKLQFETFNKRGFGGRITFSWIMLSYPNTRTKGKTTFKFSKLPFEPRKRVTKRALSVCLVWQWWELILIELSLRELILVKSESDVNWFMFGCTHLKVIFMGWCCLDNLN